MDCKPVEDSCVGQIANYLVIHGQPIPTNRPRHTMFNGHIHTYLPKTSREWELVVKETAEKWMVENNYKRPRADVPIALVIDIHMQVPKKLTKIEQAFYKLRKLFGRVGDVDNYAKGVMDGLTMAKFWYDDANVVDLRVRKFYDDEPRAEVTMWTIDGLMKLTPQFKKKLRDSGEDI